MLELVQPVHRCRKMDSLKVIIIALAVSTMVYLVLSGKTTITDRGLEVDLWGDTQTQEDCN